MKHTAVALAIALATTSVQANEWAKVADTKDASWSFKKQSGKFETTDRGTPIYAVLWQVYDKREQSYRYERKYVVLKDCISEYGTLVTIHPTSGKVLYSSSYVFGGESVASTIAELMCMGAEQHARRDSGERS